MTYRIQTVVEMTGIPRPTLLAWERRHDILEPRRSESGYRYYSDDDIAVLRVLKALTDAGRPISEAVLEVQRQSATRPMRDAAPADDDPLRRAILAELLRFDRLAVERLGPELARLPMATVVERIVLPVLAAIGAGWAAGSVTIAQEHFASSWCREQLLTSFHALGGGPATGPSVMCATAPDERHDLGLLAVAVRLALAGWRVTWLGADLPTSELARAALATRPRMLAVSVMLMRPRDAVRGYARELREAVDGSTFVVVGGRATVGLETESTPELAFTPTVAELRRVLAVHAFGSV